MSSHSAEIAWQDLTQRLLEIADLDGVTGMLGWDQHVWMPAAGASYRGRQQALLSRLRHERLADPVVGDWLGILGNDDDSMADPVRAATVRNLSRNHARVRRIPSSLVAAQAEATNAAFEAWRVARADNHPGAFLPALDQVLELARQEAACVSDGRPPYDAMVDPYDPGITSADLSALFDRLVPGLQAILAQLDPAGAEPAPLAVPVDAQRRIHRRVLTTLGFDLGRGRLDEAPHPFTMGMGPRDVRLTTRYNPDDLLAGLLGTIHEAGHGMYEQGLPDDLRGTTVESAASTGVHESQSRFWENVIGRSRPFMRWLAQVVREEGGGEAGEGAVTGDALHAQANRVRRSFIRVEADEVTYNLHIAFRVQLEQALLEDRLPTADLPAAWDDRCEAALGLRPTDANQGFLQDVHWGTGLIGYFPSYTLGNVYAAALSTSMARDLPDMWTGVEAGEFAPVLGWLHDNVHSRGHLLDGPDLVAEVAAGVDPVDAFLAHLRQRHGLPAA